MIKIGNSAKNISIYSCQPKDKKELEEIINKRIESEGTNCDLNDIDTSLITDMSWLFVKSMFVRSKFTGDISKWNVSNVKYMTRMFYKSDFNGDISNWDVSNVEYMESMFIESLFNQDISNWNVSNVEDMSYMFGWSRFNKDISSWKIREDCNTNCMFINNVIKEEYKPKSLQSI